MIKPTQMKTNAEIQRTEECLPEEKGTGEEGDMGKGINCMLTDRN